MAIYCLNCNKQAVGRSKYCSDSCKVAWNRNQKRNTEALIKSVTPNRNTFFAVLQPGTLTREEIVAYLTGLTVAEIQAILDGWADGQGTKYQQGLAETGQALTYRYTADSSLTNPPRSADNALLQRPNQAHPNASVDRPSPQCNRHGVA